MFFCGFLGVVFGFFFEEVVDGFLSFFLCF